MTLPATPLTGDAAPDPLDGETLATLRSGLRLMALRALADADAAEEVAQETLARAVVSLRGATAGEIKNLGAFVHGIARHVIADAQRARHRMVGPEAIQNAPDIRSSDPLSAAVSTEERDRVRAALSRLSAPDQRILLLTFFDGLSPGEVAERLGEPAERVRKRKSRALERLRQAFLGGAGGHEVKGDTTELAGPE